MNREPADGHANRGRREGLRLELPERGAVQGVGDVCAEGLQVEVLRAATDLLVDGERDA